jgi:hypothetical protein
MKKILLLTFCAVLLISCEINSNDDIEISPWFWVIIIIAIIIKIISEISKKAREQERRQQLRNKHNNLNAVNAAYVGGHPGCYSNISDLY